MTSFSKGMRGMRLKLLLKTQPINQNLKTTVQIKVQTNTEANPLVQEKLC